MKKGDFIRIEFTGRVVHSGEIFDLTSEEDAKRNNIHHPYHRYGPVLVIIGTHMVVPGLEKRLEEMNPGEEKEFILKPEEAFGRRNVRLIKILSLSKFVKEKINPVPGMFVEIDNTKAKVQTVSGGRVRVDFNHPLAGKELSYKVKITRQITESSEKIVSLLDYYGIKANAEIKEKRAEIITEKQLNDDMKKVISETIKKWVAEITEIEFPDKKPAAKKDLN